MLLLVAFILLIGYLWTRQNSDARGRVNRALAYAYLWTKKKFSEPRFYFDPDSKNIGVVGVVSIPAAVLVENPRPLLSDLNAVDSLRFHGVNQQGAAVSVQLDRRHGRVTEASVYLRMPSGEEYQLPSLPDSRVTNTDGRRFTAAGLTFQVLEPMRKWRVVFNGHLRKRIRGECIADDHDDVVLVRFNFIWATIYNYLFFPEDFSIDYMSKIASSTSGIKNIWQLSEHFPLESLEQCGQLYGTINIGDEPEQQMLVRGFKKRKHGILNWNKVNYAVSIEGYLNNGTNFHLFAEDIDGGIPNFLYGYINLPCSMRILHIDDCKFNFAELTQSQEISHDISINFTAGGRPFNLVFRSLEAGFSRMIGDECQKKVTLTLGEVILNGKKGHGTVEYTNLQESLAAPYQLNSLPLIQEPDLTSCPDLVISFLELPCRSSKIVGGKGSSLALMTGLENTNKNFTVPRGLCITQTAFASHLKENPNIVAAIIQMEKVAWKRIEGHLPDECEKVVTAMSDSKISARLRLELQAKLPTLFSDNNVENLKFAVRSSALGEDGEEMSAAGQNETILGVKGFDQIFSAVIKCWASSFAFRSVEYKRQNGQLLNSGMGVVVQQMVPADVAGVLFSRDPLTGSLGKMILTSNYGLGESVVSALADPDTITINRSWNNQLSIDEKQVGKKSVMITMTENGTVEQEVSTDKSSEMTVSDEDALKLAQIALFLENCFGTGRDIEWAIKDGDIFLLQSRPVTNENPMTEFEIFHEMDEPTKTDTEHYSTANVGEVCPGAFCPLTMTSGLRTFFGVMQKLFSYRITCHRYDPTAPIGMPTFFGHFMFDQIQQKTWVLEEKKSAMSKAQDMGFYGRVLDDEDVCEKGRERFENPPLSAKLKITSYSIRGMMFGWLRMRRFANKCNNFKSPSVGLLTIEDVYESIGHFFVNNTEGMDTHMQVTFGSSLWNLLCFSALSGGKDLTPEHYTDFANLIGSGNGAISGEVPFLIRDLAKTIVMEEGSTKFCNMSHETALDWLKNNTSTSGKKFREFLERHGHRGMKEFDMFSISWGMNPSMFVKVLQDTARYPATLTTDVKKSIDTVETMHTQLSGIRKKLLTLAVAGAKSAVCQREQTKSWIIKYFDCVRQSFRHLADLMVKEGYLPDPDLLFFLTHEEIYTLYKTRSANLLRLAKARHRAHPIMDKMKFPELMVGYPVPIDENEKIVLDNVNQVTGFPVSKGVIKGPAKVVLSLENVHTIEPGDILITPATDIGWSPYFPMLAGVVTEIGGLVSHGAVVAREFGLPCIVGAQHATKVFQTGDIVLLDATTGIISKVI